MPQVRTNDERIQQLATSCVQNDNIEKALYSQYNVNIGLRDLNA